MVGWHFGEAKKIKIRRLLVCADIATTLLLLVDHERSGLIQSLLRQFNQIKQTLTIR